MMMVFGFIPFVLFLISLNFLDNVRDRIGAKKRLATGGAVLDGSDESAFDGPVFRLAQRRGGRVSLSEIVVVTGLDMKLAESYMDSKVDSIHVSMEVDANGRLIYVFPELVDPKVDSGGS